MPFFNAWESSDRETRLILTLAAIFFGMAVVVVFILLISRVRKNAIAKRTEALTQALQGILNSIIVNASVQESIPRSAFEFQIQQIRTIVGKSSFAKQLLISQLIRLKKNLTGTSADILRQLYLSLQLQQYSFTQLRSFHWYARARAMRELTEMQIVESAPLIEKALSSRNTILREEAFISLANLRSTKPLSFLDNYHYPVTAWMQLNAYELLQKLDPRQLPDFCQWFDHPNKTVSLFAVRMTAQFKQYSSATRLAALLKDSEADLRYAALKALTDLEVMDYLSDVKTLDKEIWSSPEYAKSYIQYIGHAQHPRQKVDALEKFLRHDDYGVRFAAAESLLNDESTRAQGEDLLRAAGEKGEALMRHLSEPLLK
ncbi:MAG TPA: HEAT repeat domain-containing protein [Chryseosolibacter sp.]